MRTPRPVPHCRRAPGAGFTLVELMVAMTVGLVLALVVSLATLSMGTQFRAVSATSSAQVNSQVALSLIDNLGRAAGAGLYNNGQPLCQSFNAWYGGAVKSNGVPLLAAQITDGGANTASDRVVFTTSSAAGPLSGMPVMVAMASADAPIVVSNSGLIAQNDVALVGVPGSAVPCTLFQVSAAPTVGTACDGNATQCKTLQHGAGGNYNPAAGTFATEPRYGFGSSGGTTGPAVVMRLGSGFRQDGFAVLCGTLVRYNAFTDNPGCSTGPLAFNGGANALVADVALMRAQYGISSGPTSDIVTNWVAASGGTWGTPSAANAGRIRAVRIVLVTRSAVPANENVTAASCTNGGGVVNTGPCSFDDAEAPVIDLSAVPVPAGRNWRQYRYRVQQAVIPLRNVIWGS